MHVKKLNYQPWQVDNSGAFHYSVIKTMDVSDFKGHYLHYWTLLYTVLINQDKNQKHLEMEFMTIINSNKTLLRIKRRWLDSKRGRQSFIKGFPQEVLPDVVNWLLPRVVGLFFPLFTGGENIYGKTCKHFSEIVWY